MLRLSQGHLNLLKTCPPKFKQSFLSQTSSLPKPETEDKQTWGSLFHLLMQQRELGLPIESLLQANTELDRSLKALIQAAPELLGSDDTIHRNQKRAAEHSRTMSFGNYLLTVVYDLLIAEEDRAKIIDWKTYLQPIKKGDLAKLADNWQTRLYLYVLAETSDYSPEQISMTYWFVKLPKKPQSQTFKYSDRLHKQNERDLTQLLNNLDRWLQNSDGNFATQAPQASFPHHDNCQLNCPYARELLENHTLENTEIDFIGDRSILQNQIENISEIPI